jgi:ABC-type sugar transport system ATPase subunit
MNLGVLQQVGPPKEVYARPANVFVAGFLGSPPMNLLHADVVSANGTAALAIGGATLPIGSLQSRLARLPPGASQTILGVRPEDVALGHEASPGAIPGEVFVVEDLGNERLVTIDLGGQFAVARTAAADPAEMGDRVWLGFVPERAHLFDPVSERRID